jgi:hypothetical protein
LGYFYGNVTEPCDVRAAPGKSFLFFLTVISMKTLMTAESVCLEKRSKDWKSTPISGVSGAAATTREKQGERMIFQSRRTHNRIRFSRCAASSD